MTSNQFAFIKSNIHACMYMIALSQNSCRRIHICFTFVPTTVLLHYCLFIKKRLLVIYKRNFINKSLIKSDKIIRSIYDYNFITNKL